MIAETVLQQADTADRERLDRITRAWDAYYGRLPDALKASKTDPAGKDNVKFNYSSLIVDIGVSFLFGKALGFQVDDAKESAEDEWLEGCLGENHIASLLLKLGINGAVCGDAYMMLLPPKPPSLYPRLLLPDPATVTPIYDMDDFEDVLAWKRQWNAIDPATGKPVVRRQIIEREGRRWKITDQISRAIPGGNVMGMIRQLAQGKWETLSESVWPYAWSPLFHCQNLPAPNEFWGKSDLEDVVGINESVNFSISNGQRIERNHGSPKTWGRGFQANQLDVGPDAVTILPNQQAELRNLEMQSDLAGIAALYRLRKDALHEITRTPEVATGKVDNIGALSGVALQTLFQPLLQKTETKKVLYGEMIEEVGERALQMGGFGEEHEVVLQWPDLLPKNDLEERQTALVDEQLGVSEKTVLEKLGYNPEAEAKQKQMERKTLGETLLTQFDRGQGGGVPPSPPYTGVEGGQGDAGGNAGDNQP